MLEARIGDPLSSSIYLIFHELQTIQVILVLWNRIVVPEFPFKIINLLGYEKLNNLTKLIVEKLFDLLYHHHYFEEFEKSELFEKFLQYYGKAVQCF